VLAASDQGNTKTGMLVGTAVRCMLGMCWLEMTRAYAYGLYVDSSVLRQLAQRRYEWMLSDDEAGDRPVVVTADGKPDPTRFLLDEKARHPKAWGELTMCLRMAQDIDGPHMAHGFKNSGE
jgi:hypothetical protein